MEKAFLEHFKISEEEVHSLLAENTQALSALEVLFEKHKIDSAQYLQWAKDFYGLPILKESFFEHHNQVEHLLSRYRNVFPRNVVPFYEWDGVLYVMCLEPVEFDAPQKIQYILAPLELIQRWSPATSKSSETQVTSLFHLKKMTSEEMTSKEVIGKEITSNDNAREDLTSDFTQTQDLKPDSLEAEEPTQNFEKLSSLDFGNIAIPGTASQPTPSPAPAAASEATFDPAALLTAEAPSSTEASPEVAESAAMPEGLNFPAAPGEQRPDYAVSQAITAADLKDFKKSAASMPTPSPLTPPATPAAPSLQEVPIVTSEAEATHTGIIVSNEGATGILNQLKRHFDQAMILHYEGGILKPLKWDGSWTKAAHSQKAIDLKSASIFRIVHDTKSSYHGHIIPNSINDAFFQSWNKGAYPQHITICPVLDHKTIVGMVLGTCSALAAQKFQLRHIETIAQECGETVLKPQRQSAA